MQQLTTIVGLFLVMCIYGISVVGIRKYEIITTIKMLRKKEVLGLCFFMVVLFLGLLMQASRFSMMLEGGLITNSVVSIANYLFSNNTTIVSLAVLIITIFPAYIFQVFAISKLVAKLNIPYVQIFFYMMVYALNVGLYSKLVFSVGEAMIYVLLSAFVYYLVMVLSKVRGKKDFVYLMGYVGLLVLLICLEGSVCLPIILISLLTIVECVLLAMYWTKSIILRRTLRKVGLLIIVIGFIWFNSVM